MAKNGRKPRIKYEIQRTLVLSTGHIPWSDAEIFDKIKDMDEHQAMDYYWVETPEFGYRILVHEDSEQEITTTGRSVALLNLVKLARRLRCKWLLLDADADLRDDLPKFDW